LVRSPEELGEVGPPFVRSKEGTLAIGLIWLYKCCECSIHSATDRFWIILHKFM
jgi:hypothetical protein